MKRTHTGKLKKISLGVFDQQGEDEEVGHEHEDKASGSILPVPSTSSSSSSSSSFISPTVVSANAASAAASAAEAMRIAAKLSSSLSSLTPSQPSLSLQSSASTDDAQAPQPSAAFSYVTSIPSGRSSSSSTSSTAGPGSQPTTSTQRRNRWGPAQSSSSVSAAEPDIEQVVATFSSSDSSYDDERMRKLVQEQKELQMLESRIREANAGMATSSSSAAISIEKLPDGVKGGAHAANISSNLGLGLALSNPVFVDEETASLYMERLQEYNELAAQYDANYKDTVEEAERSGGVIEGGTWEHRKRAKEMLTTAKRNLELTVQANTKHGHHMSDYLPPEVLEKFLKQSRAIANQDVLAAKELQLSAEAEANKNKLTESNLGFQLLKKSGWTEGSGLGAGSSGIVNPIGVSSSIPAGLAAAIASINSKSSFGAVGSMPQMAPPAALDANMTGSGLGAKASHDVEESDDAFDQYRKRMMLAYKFRPNPLNNPRRSYY